MFIVFESSTVLHAIHSKTSLTILLKESMSAFDAVSLSGFRLVEAFFSPDDSSSPEGTL
jgi:hypothetical protein